MLQKGIERLFTLGKNCLATLGGTENVCVFLVLLALLGWLVTALCLRCKKSPAPSAEIAETLQKNSLYGQSFSAWCRFLLLLTATAVLFDVQSESRVFQNLSSALLLLCAEGVLFCLLANAMRLLVLATNKRMQKSYEHARIAEERRLLTYRREVQQAGNALGGWKERLQNPSLAHGGETDRIVTKTEIRMPENGTKTDVLAQKPEAKPPVGEPKTVEPKPPVEAPNVAVPIPVGEPKTPSETPAKAVSEERTPTSEKAVETPANISEKAVETPAPISEKACERPEKSIDKRQVDDLLARLRALPLTEHDALSVRKIELSLRDELAETAPSQGVISTLITALVKMVSKYEASA